MRFYVLNELMWHTQTLADTHEIQQLIARLETGKMKKENNDEMWQINKSCLQFIAPSECAPCIRSNDLRSKMIESIR